MICVVFAIFVYWLERNQKTYIKHFRDEVVEMTDFAIKVKTVPRDVQYGCDPANLKVALIQHFESLIKRHKI